MGPRRAHPEVVLDSRIPPTPQPHPQPIHAQELFERRGGRHGLPVPNSPYGLRGRKVTLKKNTVRSGAQELCESRGGRPGPLSSTFLAQSLIVLMISVDVKQH